MKDLHSFIKERMSINESASEKEFIDYIQNIIDNTDSSETFNKRCEELYNVLAQYEDVEIEKTSVIDIEKGAVYCYLAPVDDTDPIKKQYGQNYHLTVEFGLTGGGIGFSSRPISSFVKDKYILCGTGVGDGVNLVDYKSGLTPKDVIKDHVTLKKIGKSPNLTKFLKNLRKLATKW